MFVLRFDMFVSVLFAASCLFSVRQALDFPSALALVMETDGAPDPLFGVMQDVTLSPTTLIKVPKNKTKE